MIMVMCGRRFFVSGGGYSSAQALRRIRVGARCPGLLRCVLAFGDAIAGGREGCRGERFVLSLGLSKVKT